MLDLIKGCIDMNMPSPWTCQVCSTVWAKLNMEVWAKLNMEVKQVMDRVTVNEGKIASLEPSVLATKDSSEKIEERVQALEDQLGKVDTNASEAGEARVLEEIAARNFKDCNLVLHNCPE